MRSIKSTWSVGILIEILLIISVLSLCLFSLIEGNTLSLYSTITLIIYAFFSIVGLNEKLTMGPGMMAAKGIAFVRYVVFPTLIILHPSSVNKSIISIMGFPLFIYEELAVLTTIIYITNKSRIDDRIFQIDREPETYTFYYSIAIISLLLLVQNPSLLGIYNLIWESTDAYTVVKTHSVITGLSSLLHSWGRLLLPLCILHLINNSQFLLAPNKYYLSLLTILIGYFIVFTGSSRNSALIPAFASIFVLIRLFPEYKQRTLVCSLTMLLIGFILMTRLKHSYTGFAYTDMSDLIDSIQRYFAGPINVGYSYLAYISSESSFTIETRITDLLGNLPGLASHLDLSNRTSTIFNNAYYSGGISRDQIVPMVGQGLFHFGTIFSVLPSVASVLLTAYFDNSNNDKNSIPSCFIYSFASIRCGMFGISNMSILLSTFYQTIIPLLFIFKVSEAVTRESAETRLLIGRSKA